MHCAVRFRAPINVAASLLDGIHDEEASLIGASDGSTPLHLACALPDAGEAADFVQHLGTKESAVALDNNGKTPMIIAVENENTSRSVIEALGKLNPESVKIQCPKGRTPFRTAIRRKATESIVKAVLRLYPRAVKYVSDDGNNIFHEMCQFQTATPIVAGLLQVHPAGSKQQNSKGNLPLHIAAAYNLPIAVIEAFIEAYQGAKNDAIYDVFSSILVLLSHLTFT